VCRKRDMIKMFMVSTGFLRIWIDSGSGLLTLIMSTFYYCACIMMISAMNFMYKIY
jgi:hypothetical protein